jgi:hypothetical protein
MTTSLPLNAFDREARILLRRLAKSRNGLRKIDSPDGPRWCMGGKGRADILPGLVDLMKERSLLRETPDGVLRPSAAGLRMIDSLTPDATLLSQHAVVEPPSAPQRPAVNRTECAINWLANRQDRRGRPLLSDEQLAAAERLRADFERAQLGSRVTADWDRPIGSDGARREELAPSERSLAAKSRFFAALDAVGPELSGIVVEVCCLAAGLEQAERRLMLPARSGKAVLQLALTGLARHYGLLQGVRRPLPVRTWATPDYRPEL